MAGPASPLTHTHCVWEKGTAPKASRPLSMLQLCSGERVGGHSMEGGRGSGETWRGWRGRAAARGRSRDEMVILSCGTSFCRLG